MGCGVGFSIRELYWNRFFGGEKKNIDIFELIDAAIRVAPIERRSEFLCRRMDIIHFLLEDHSTGKENNPRKVLNQDDDTIVSPCPDDEFVNGPNKKRKADDYHYFNVKAEKKIRRSFEQENQKKVVNSDDEKENHPRKVANQDEGSPRADDDVSDFANQLERELLDAPNKKTKAANDDYHSNVNKEGKRSFEEQENYIGKKGVESDMYENKFEVSKTRLVERNQQIQRSKRRVQILEVAPKSGYCNGKHVFGNRIEKSKILGNNCSRLQQQVF